MKKLKSKSGMTLMEMMASLLILTLLVTAMGTGMDTAMNVYGDAMFESNSASLAGIVNTALSDVLRHAQDVKTKNLDANEFFVDATGAQVPNVGFVFTNLEYGVRDAYFQTKNGTDITKGVLILRTLHTENGSDEDASEEDTFEDDASGESGSKQIVEVELVNPGAYINLFITNFEVTYVAPGAVSAIELNDGSTVNTKRGGYFYITYDIRSSTAPDDTTKVRKVETIVRLLNA